MRYRIDYVRKYAFGVMAILKDEKTGTFPITCPPPPHRPRSGGQGTAGRGLVDLWSTRQAMQPALKELEWHCTLTWCCAPCLRDRSAAAAADVAAAICRGVWIFRGPQIPQIMQARPSCCPSYED